MNSRGEGSRTPYNTWWGLQQSPIVSSITSVAPSHLPCRETRKSNKKSTATRRSSASRMQLSSNALESHSISPKMCNQAKRWVEWLFSSSKDVSRSQNVQELPSNHGQLLFIAKRYAASHYRTTQFKTSWPDVSGHYRTSVNSVRQK
jgi:hypothetical protein